MFEHGIETVRADFHLHTNKDKEFRYRGEANSYINNYVAALKARQIRVGVITNHNKFDRDEYKNIRKKAKKEDILILPGVELSVNQGRKGVHTLIVFDPDAWLTPDKDHINIFLNRSFRDDDRESKNILTSYDLDGMFSELDSYGRDYFVIFAHVEQDSGFLKECSGGSIENLSGNPSFRKHVLAFQKMSTRDNIPKLRQWMGYVPPNVEGSDPKSIEDIGKGDAVYLKLGAMTYDAVRFALEDHENRIVAEEALPSHGYIRSAEFIGGKLDGVRLDLSNSLNTLIGIRGSGKSTILEVIRYALTLEPREDVAYKDQLVKEAIGSGGKVILTVQDRQDRIYRISRIFGQDPEVFDPAGNPVERQAGSLLQNPLYFGQKDLSTNDNYEFELLKRLVGSRIQTRDEQLKAANNAVRAAVADYREALEAQEQRKQTDLLLRDARHKMQIFQESGIEAKLSQQTCCSNDKTALDDMWKQLTTVQKSIRTALGKFDAKKLQLKTHSSEYNADIFAEAEAVLQQMHACADAMRANFAEMDEQMKRFDGIIGDLAARIQSHQEDFAEVRRNLQAESLDPETYLLLSSQITELEKKLAQQQEKTDSAEAMKQQLRQALDERTSLLQQVSDAYAAEAEKINASQKELQISVTFRGARDRFKNHMKKALRGSSVSELQYVQMAQLLPDYAAVLEDVYLNDGGILKTIMNTSTYETLRGLLLSKYTELLDHKTEDRVQIKYHGKPLGLHSIGQRASALILLLLTQTDNDLLIIDQPEDDLDNKVIYEELIRTLHRRKSDLQFLFATHNANIPVLGDSEKVIAAEYMQTAIRVDQGNIDDPRTRTQIINIMEGGRDAFDRRKNIYANWRSR